MKALFLGRWLLLVLFLAAVPVRAQDMDDPLDEAFEEEKPADPAGTAAYEKALKKQQKRVWKSARNAFRKFIKNYPDHPMVPAAEARSGDNAFLGTEIIHEGGPSARRIDVAVMGDGFPIDAGDQKQQERWAHLCIDVLFNEKGFDQYKNYFNIWFVRLASLEEGVDPSLSPEEIAKKQKKNLQRRRALNYKIDYSTALNCKAAGPGGQVMADRGLVYKWLEIADRDKPGVGDDKFVIAFAQFGRLGMGGGGVANVGRPDKSITVHEFGHAFSRLLDEYTNDPRDPNTMGQYGRSIKAANAYMSPVEPKKDEVPWAHMLKKRVKGVGIYLGGATFKKGVYRPAASCAMNVGGVQFCPVCREQSILVIYEYVSPLDELSPEQGKAVTAITGDDTVLTVLPMKLKRKKLKVDWYVRPEVGRKAVTPGADADGEEDLEAIAEDEIDEEADELGGLYGREQRNVGFGNRFAYRGDRARRNRDHYAEPPPGDLSKLGKVVKGKRKDKGKQFHVFPVGKLSPGRYRVTVEVRDETKWVIKDDRHLLKERATWRVIVEDEPKPAPPPKK